MFAFVHFMHGRVLITVPNLLSPLEWLFMLLNHRAAHFSQRCVIAFINVLLTAVSPINWTPAVVALLLLHLILSSFMAKKITKPGTGT